MAPKAGPTPPAKDPDDPWTANYVNDEHVQAFASALDYNDTLTHEPGDVSPASPRSPPLAVEPNEAALPGSNGRQQHVEKWKYGPDNGSLGSGRGSVGGGGEKVEKLTATSDFAPIHQRVSRRRAHSSQQGWTYHLIRWPLLGFIFFIISLEFNAYVITRQVVNVLEFLLAWRGKKGKLRQELRNAKTYAEWVAAAKKLDALLEFDEWKETDDDGYYDYILVKRVKRTLIRLRAAKDTRGLMDALAVCVRPNFAGTEGVKMFSETFYGTKRLVEAHVKEVGVCLDYVRTATDVSPEEKRAFFRAINKNYGSSALCLSGGASFGYYHFGVIKAFLEADLLPRVITGTSAGGLVAALLCTRTNEELKVLLVPELADKITACEDPLMVWFKRWRKTGARFSAVEWARKAMFFTRGSLTFKEAYERTGRALNVSVVPSDRHSPTILLNHLTAPNCIIWSAIIASAAVPGILNPVVLMAKDRNGGIKPHNLGGSRFKDGSLREDIPLGSLHTQFNCNFSIVSQTNPHIHLFFFAPRGSVGRPVAHRKGRGWRGGFILSALESYIKLDLNKHFKVIRDLDLMPQILQSDWSGVFLQRFSGDLTLTPRSTASDWFRLLSDPDRNQLERMLNVGQRVAWPALHMVKERMTIERAIFRGRSEVRAAMHRERTTNDASAALAQDSNGGGAMNQVPIESDADAGFASRTRRIKAAHRAPASAAEIFGNAPEGSRMAAAALRRRRPPSTRSSRRRPSEVVFDPPPPEQEEAVQAPGQASAPGTVVPSPARSSYAALGDTFRNVRASSLSAFSPFRSMRSFSSGQSDAQSAKSAPLARAVSDEPQQAAVSSQTPRPSVPPPQQHVPNRRSQLSITRWFGGGDESSSDEDPEGEHAGQAGVDDTEGSVSVRSGSRSGDEHGFGRGVVMDEDEDDDGQVVVDDDDEEEGDSEDEFGGGRTPTGLPPSSGGADRLGRGAFGGGMRTAGGAGGRGGQIDRRAEYSPPQQDRG